MFSHSGKYANLLLPLPLPGFFTYAVPQEMEASLVPGVRVVVQFGKKKLYTALVYNIHETKPGSVCQRNYGADGPAAGGLPTSICILGMVIRVLYVHDGRGDECSASSGTETKQRKPDYA